MSPLIEPANGGTVLATPLPDRPEGPIIYVSVVHRSDERQASVMLTPPEARQLAELLIQAIREATR